MGTGFLEYLHFMRMHSHSISDLFITQIGTLNAPLLNQFFSQSIGGIFISHSKYKFEKFISQSQENRSEKFLLSLRGRTALRAVSGVCTGSPRVGPDCPESVRGRYGVGPGKNHPARKSGLLYGPDWRLRELLGSSILRLNIIKYSSPRYQRNIVPRNFRGWYGVGARYEVFPGSVQSSESLQGPPRWAHGRSAGGPHGVGTPGE